MLIQKYTITDNVIVCNDNTELDNFVYEIVKKHIISARSVYTIFTPLVLDPLILKIRVELLHNVKKCANNQVDYTLSLNTAYQISNMYTIVFEVFSLIPNMVCINVHKNENSCVSRGRNIKRKREVE